MKSKGSNTLTLILACALASAATYIATTKWADIKSLADAAKSTITTPTDSALHDTTDKATDAASASPVAAPADSIAVTTLDMPKGTVLFVTGDGVRLRTGPGLSYEIYKNVSKGQRLAYNYTSGEWYCVTFGGRNLFINKDFASQKAVLPTPSVPVKDAAKDSKEKKSTKDNKTKKTGKDGKSTKKTANDSITR